MKNKSLITMLTPLKIELQNNSIKLQPCFNRHIKNIDEALEYGYPRIEIFKFIFEENHKISFKYFENILFRARKKQRENKGKYIITQKEDFNSENKNPAPTYEKKTKPFCFDWRYL